MPVFSKKTTYIADPADLNRRLTRSELRELQEVQGKGFINDKQKVMHFIERVAFTFEDAERRQGELDRKNMEFKAQLASGGGYASNLTPEQSLQYIAPEVLAKHGGDAARALAQQAEYTKKHYSAINNEMKMKIMDALESGTLDAQTTNLLRGMLTLLES